MENFRDKTGGKRDTDNMLGYGENPQPKPDERVEVEYICHTFAPNKDDPKWNKRTVYISTAQLHALGYYHKTDKRILDMVEIDMPEIEAEYLQWSHNGTQVGFGVWLSGSKPIKLKPQ